MELGIPVIYILLHLMILIINLRLLQVVKVFSIPANRVKVIPLVHGVARRRMVLPRQYLRVTVLELAYIIQVTLVALIYGGRANVAIVVCQGKALPAINFDIAGAGPGSNILNRILGGEYVRDAVNRPVWALQQAGVDRCRGVPKGIPVTVRQVDRERILPGLAPVCGY